MDAPLIRIEGMSKTYAFGAQTMRALSGVSVEVRAGELLTVAGPSGSGKTTLLNLIGCLDRPSCGRYWLSGEAVEGLSDDALARLRNRRIGFVFQSFHLIPGMSARDNVALPLVYAGFNAETRRRLALQALERVGLGLRADALPRQLSGGQQQRVAIARALSNGPSLILADEPTGSLERRSASAILSLFEELNRDGATILIVTHDPRVAARTRRVLHLQDGELVKDAALGHGD